MLLRRGEGGKERTRWWETSGRVWSADGGGFGSEDASHHLLHALGGGFSQLQGVTFPSPEIGKCLQGAAPVGFGARASAAFEVSSPFLAIPSQSLAQD